MPRSRRIKTEITPEAFKKWLEENPGIRFDGLRYTVPIEYKGHIWHKPVASTETIDGQQHHYLITD